MLPLECPDRIHVAFDDHRLVTNAGLLLPVTLAHHLGLGELVDNHVDLGRAPGRANAGDKMLTLVASALAGGDCIDDADVLRTGGTAGAIGCIVKAPSTLGIFLRSFSWGHVRQLDRVSRELQARAWADGAGPGDGPLTIDLDSTICETYGLGNQRCRWHRRRADAAAPIRFGAAGQPGIAELEGQTKPGDPLRMPGLKAKSAQQQPRKQRRHGFARPRMTPITIRQHASVRNIIEATFLKRPTTWGRWR